jgi:hypothetical protein
MNDLKTFILQLCYVDECWAYFTTQPINAQWGDDWNDAPYEHNAGTPYGPCWHNEPTHRKEGKFCDCDSCKKDWYQDEMPKWKIVKVAWDGPFETPANIANGNSLYSVQQINRGEVAWLRSSTTQPSTPIMAGVSLEQFCRLIQAGGGRVYQETPQQDS